MGWNTATTTPTTNWYHISLKMRYIKYKLHHTYIRWRRGNTTPAPIRRFSHLKQGQNTINIIKLTLDTDESLPGTRTLTPPWSFTLITRLAWNNIIKQPNQNTLTLAVDEPLGLYTWRPWLTFNTTNYNINTHTHTLLGSLAWLFLEAGVTLVYKINIKIPLT